MNLKLDSLGLLKLSHLANFDSSILKHFTPYWEDFKPYMRELKSAFWPTSFETANCITYDRMLSILKDAKAHVQEVDVQSGGLDAPVLQSYVLLNSKRSRQGQDVAVVSKRSKTFTAASSSRSRMNVQDYGIWKESIMVPISDEF
jgi:hypothetical protein